MTLINRLFQRVMAPEEEGAGGGGEGGDPAAVTIEPGEVPVPAETGENWQGENPFTDPNLTPGEMPDVTGIEGEPPADEPKDEPKEEEIDIDLDIEPKDKPKDGEKPASRKTLRAELEERRAQIEAFETEVTDLRADRDSLNEQIKELRGEVESRDTRYAETRQVGAYNPQEDPDLKPITEAMGVEVRHAVAKMSTKEAGELFNSDVNRMLTGYTQTIEAGENLQSWREAVGERFDMDDVERIERVMESLHSKNTDRFRIMRENGANWEKRVEESYRSSVEEQGKFYGRLGAWGEEEIEANPYHPDAILTKLAEKNEGFADVLKKARKDALQVAVGLPPLKPNASQEEIAAYRAQEQVIEEARSKAPYALAQMDLFAKVIPTLYKEVLALRKRVKESAEGGRADSEYSAPAEKPPAEGAVGEGILAEDEEYGEAVNPYLNP